MKQMFFVLLATLLLCSHGMGQIPQLMSHQGYVADGTGTRRQIDGSPPAPQLINSAGYMLAIDGDLAIVGTQWEDGYRGAAYLYKRTGSTWIQQQKLSPSDLGEFDHFGSSVAVDGEYAFVGASWQNTMRGALYIFKLNGEKWVQEQKFSPKGAMPGDRFGSRMSLDGGRLIIGSKDKLPAAYTLDRLADSWTIEKTTTSISDITAGASDLPPAGISLLNVIHQFNGTTVPVLSTMTPPAPDTVTASHALFEDRTEVRWTRVPLSAITYKIRRNGTLLSLASSRDSVYFDRTGVRGTTYNYCITVADMNDVESPAKCDSGSRTVFPPASVDASDGLFADRVQVKWIDQSSVEQGYIVKRNGSQIGINPSNTQVFDDTGATAGTRYKYTVLAFDSSASQSAATGSRLGVLADTARKSRQRLH